MSWKLTFIVLTIVPMYAIVTLQFTRKAKELMRANQDIQAAITVHISEKFGGIQTIKSYCAEELEIGNYMRANMES
jgi:ABC-type multidrug transport system fused ATPase/permease subunit